MRDQSARAAVQAFDPSVALLVAQTLQSTCATGIYSVRLENARSTKAMLRASNPRRPISGIVLAVAGSVEAVNCSAGGAVTTWASSTSSPVGWTARMGATRSCATTGSSAGWIGASTSTGSSAGVNRTAVLVD